MQGEPVQCLARFFEPNSPTGDPVLAPGGKHEVLAQSDGTGCDPGHTDMLSTMPQESSPISTGRGFLLVSLQVSWAAARPR